MKNQLYKPEEVKKLLDFAWLNLDNIFEYAESHSIIHKGFWDGTDDDVPVNLVKVLLDPDYFYYTVKMLLGIELLPFQCVILKELWTKPFPMLIASRGGSKCVTGDTRIITNIGVKTIKEIIPNTDIISQRQYLNDLYIFGENGYNKIEYAWVNKPQKTIKILTHHGYSVCGISNHKIRVFSDSKIIWKQLDEINTNDKIIIERTCHNFVFGGQKTDINEDLSYLFGLLVGDGGYTVRGRITITSADQEILDEACRISLKHFGKPFRKQHSSKYSWLLCGVDIWDKMFRYYGFNSSECSEKDVPSCIFNSTKENIISFLQGLFDTDGTFNRNRVGYCSKSKELVRSIQFLLNRLGIICRIKPRLNKKYNTIYYYLTITGPSLWLFRDRVGFRLTRKQDKLNNYCNNKISNPNIDVIPSELISSDLLEIIKISNRRCKFIKKYVLKTYDISYDKIRKFLVLYKDYENTEEYKRILNIYNKNYFFDKVDSINLSEDITYDLHIPNDHTYISNGIISHNSFLLGVYAILRCVLCQGSKVVICGAGFRQSKIVFEYCESFWYRSPILRDICGASSTQGPKHDTDRWHMKIGDSIIIAIPIGSGDKIRGIRATHLISDEFASINPEVYENVIQGFASVSADPVSNVKIEARKSAEKKMGIAQGLAQISKMGNQSILSGTTYYTFNHFFTYWRKYKGIIESRGNINKLRDIFSGEVPEEFDYRDFSVIRLPYHLLPKGFMDIKQIHRSKSMQHSSMFNLEYGAVFSDDSNGFYKRSLIECCVANTKNNIILPSGPIEYSAMIRGNPHKEYIYGIDPASESDNFAIVIIEVNNDHRKIVYCWTVTRKLHKQKVAKDPNIEKDYYAYCCRKVRELMFAFPCKFIGLDTQGGGIAVEEGLHDDDKIKLELGEKPIWKIIDPDKPDPTDTMSGLHIIHRINFADAEWVAEANHGMRKDMEDKFLLFPEFDSVSLGLAAEQDALNNRMYDTLEDCVMEIEELKDEMSSIIHTQTGITGRDKWDTPEVKIAGGKKGRMRKDRYTALLIANAVARKLEREIVYKFHETQGSFANIAGKDTSGRLFYGPEDFCQAMQSVYGND